MTSDDCPVSGPVVSTARFDRVERLRPVFELIETRLSEDLPVSRAASTVGMSPSHFRRFFKQTMGRSYVRYLHAYRVERACSLIASSDRTLSEIAMDVGFCDQSYFGLVFRRVLKKTPAAYRRELRGRAPLATTTTAPPSALETTPPPASALQSPTAAA